MILNFCILIKNTTLQNIDLINRYNGKISLLGLYHDIYDTSKSKKEEKHYTEIYGCNCSKYCDFKVKIIVLAKCSCADIMYTGTNHEENWKSDITLMPLDARVKHMIKESSLGISKDTPKMIYQEKEKIRKNLSLSIHHGSFHISHSGIANRIYQRRFVVFL